MPALPGGSSGRHLARCAMFGFMSMVMAGPALTQGGPTSNIADIDLSKPFAARAGWRFVATQGVRVPHPYLDNETAPGEVQVCVRMLAAGQCVRDIVAMPPWPSGADWAPHFLKAATIVHPFGRSMPPLLLLRTASLASFDGDYAEFTALVAYRSTPNRFVPIYQKVIGHNQNQEVRLITTGRLAGSVISVEPTENAPFSYWVTVNRLSKAYLFRQVLRYRSATHYGDGNPLAVIDSEMPNIQRRLGLWRPGKPLPLPEKHCGNPHLVNAALWCA